MNTEWNLDIFYKGYDTPEFKEDFAKVEALAKGLDEKLALAKTQDAKTGLLTVLFAQEEFYALAMKVGEYISLRSSVNTTDGQTNDYMGKFDMVLNQIKNKE